ncbi:nitroreductase family protein [Alpinimonas psychrophila]|uniref:Nitroreductase n=1 Tax=Alpinimonas psychrophila TaxID=748908 RepID=A0A7W3PPK3_9MICO|nr:nitroreductase [Alpinimonas psychrophila]
MITPEQFSAFAASRRSTRDFLPTPIDPQIIDDILTDAMTAPSWSNLRSFMVGVATGERRDRLSAEMLRRWAAVARARSGGVRGVLGLLGRPWAIPVSDYNMVRPYPTELAPRGRKIGAELYKVLGVARQDTAGRDAQTAHNYEFFGAPVEIFLFAHKGLGVYSVSDASLFAENLMLSAHARGLGACAQGSVALWSKVVRREFRLPRRYKLVYGIALGYPSEHAVNSFQAERLPLSDIIVEGV